MISINGLQVPASLEKAIESGEWRKLERSKKIHQVFSGREIFAPEFYNTDMMREDNARWVNETAPLFLGVAHDGYEPGWMDPKQSLVIGVINTDWPITLDYSKMSSAGPAVACPILAGQDFVWVYVSPDIETFMDSLR